MMRHVTVGQTISISAKDRNAIADAVNDYLSRKANRLNATTTADKAARRELVYNATGRNLPRYSVVGVRAVRVTPNDDVDVFRNTTVYSGSVPSTTYDGGGRWGVTLEPLAVGAIGRIATTGSVPVLVDDNSQGGVKRADIVNGETGYLQLTSSGGADVLYRPGGPGAEWSIVRLGQALAIFPVMLQATGGSQATDGTWDSETQAWTVPPTPASWTYSVIDAGGAVLLTGVDPTASPHHVIRQPWGAIGQANYGIAQEVNGAIVLLAINESWQPTNPLPDLTNIYAGMDVLEQNQADLSEAQVSLNEAIVQLQQDYTTLEQRVTALGG